MKSLAHLIFGHFGGENVTFLRDYDVITLGFPAKNGEIPSKSRFRPISSCNVHADNQTQCNGTCFVQNSFIYRFHPLAPPYPTPLAHPSCSYPPCPFLQPFPPTILPPLPKLNRQLKIVNYFTCVRHFFCRWCNDTQKLI